MSFFNWLLSLFLDTGEKIRKPEAGVEPEEVLPDGFMRSGA